MHRYISRPTSLAITALVVCAAEVHGESPLFTAQQAPRPTLAAQSYAPATVAPPSSSYTLAPANVTGPALGAPGAVAVPAANAPELRTYGPAYAVPQYGNAPYGNGYGNGGMYGTVPYDSVDAGMQASEPFPTGVVSTTIVDQPYEPVPAATGWRADWDDYIGGLQPGPAPCKDCPSQGLYLYHSYSSWRGYAEGSGASNNGFLYGFNYASRLGALSDATGIGAQLGGTYGLYDLNGRDTGFHDNSVQQQFFVTGGLFRKADTLTNWSAGIVCDITSNTRFGQYAVSPFMTQLRGQVAYAINDKHEIGLWGTMRLTGHSEDVPGVGTLSFRAVDQLNLFYHHRFFWGGDGWSWIGIPDHTKLGGNGSLGAYTFGGTLTAPLSPRFSGFTDLQYMAPTAHAGAAAAREESFFVAVGVAFYPGRNARADNVSGNCWMPYMPVANNGSFIVDTNKTF